MMKTLTIFFMVLVLMASSQAVIAEQNNRINSNFCKGCIKTGKERMGRKGNDEQRVNDCKVPIKKRGLKLRSADCVHKRPRIQ